MAVKQSNAAKGVENVAYPHYAGQVVRNRFSFSVLASAALVVGDIIELGVIPSNCEVVDVILDTDTLDSHGSPTLAVDVGVMSGAWGDEDQARTSGDEIFDGLAIGAGGAFRPTLASAFRIPRAEALRSIGVRVTAAAATAATGNINLTVLVAA